MRRGYRRYRRGNECGSILMAAFGLGLFLAIFGSLRLALLIAAIALIYFGLNARC